MPLSSFWAVHGMRVFSMTDRCFSSTFPSLLIHVVGDVSFSRFSMVSMAPSCNGFVLGSSSRASYKFNWSAQISIILFTCVWNSVVMLVICSHVCWRIAFSSAEISSSFGLKAALYSSESLSMALGCPAHICRNVRTPCILAKRVSSSNTV